MNTDAEPEWNDEEVCEVMAPELPQETEEEKAASRKRQEDLKLRIRAIKRLHPGVLINPNNDLLLQLEGYDELELQAILENMEMEVASGPDLQRSEKLVFDGVSALTRVIAKQTTGKEIDIRQELREDQEIRADFRAAGGGRLAFLPSLVMLVARYGHLVYDKLREAAPPVIPLDDGGHGVHPTLPADVYRTALAEAGFQANPAAGQQEQGGGVTGGLTGGAPHPS